MWPTRPAGIGLITSSMITLEDTMPPILSTMQCYDVININNAILQQKGLKFLHAPAKFSLQQTENLLNSHLCLSCRDLHSTLNGRVGLMIS